jgi:hypothetical protein
MKNIDGVDITDGAKLDEKITYLRPLHNTGRLNKL